MSHTIKSVATSLSPDGKEIRLCFDVDPGSGSSGNKKQFVDIRLTLEQAEQVKNKIFAELENCRD